AAGAVELQVEDRPVDGVLGVDELLPPGVVDRPGRRHPPGKTQRLEDPYAQTRQDDAQQRRDHSDVPWAKRRRSAASRALSPGGIGGRGSAGSPAPGSPEPPRLRKATTTTRASPAITAAAGTSHATGLRGAPITVLG